MNTTEPPAKAKRRWLSVLALSAAGFVDSSEDYTLSILWPFMYPSLSVSIGQLGPALGIGNLVRTLTAPFWGYAADRFSRKALLVGVTGVWGAWTLVLGLVQNISQLLLVRLVASLGLAVLWPTAFSLLSDLFESKMRGRAAGVMTAASFSGTFAAYAILPALAVASPEGWRSGFMVIGLASIASGLLLLLVHDPPRGAAEPELHAVLTEEAAARYRFRLADLPAIARVRSWWVLLFHHAADVVAVSVLYGWSFTWLNEIGLGDSAFLVVASLMFSTLLGHVLFGWLGDRLEIGWPRRGRLVMALIGLTVSVPALAGFIALGRHGMAPLLLFGLLSGLSLSSIDTGARWPVTQGVLRPELRASGRAALDMVIGLMSSLAVSVSGGLVHLLSGDVTLMLLILIPAPKLLAAGLWLPLFKSYPRDQQALHQLLSQRQQEIIEGR
ncbi:MAG: MFS transporter [Chloroflexi bacterium]|nr:MFS transporter [Chloroflexota bacterium]